MSKKNTQRRDNSLITVSSNLLGDIKRPPIPKHLEFLERNQKGFFIINPKDESIFKWIDIESLECNGVDSEGHESKHGRRNFNGIVFPTVFGSEGYFETSDKQYEECVKKFGGFYISIFKARKRKGSNRINFTGRGEVVDLITFDEATELAKRYDIEYEIDAISELPCGAAMDAIFEEIFERFMKEVLIFKNEDETEYEAWNRYEEKFRTRFRKEGIYGIYDLFAEGEEITSEVCGYIEYPATRCGQRGMYLIGYHERERKLKKASFILASRNFTSGYDRFYGQGYRIMLLPK